MKDDNDRDQTTEDIRILFSTIVCCAIAYMFYVGVNFELKPKSKPQPLTQPQGIRLGKEPITVEELMKLYESQHGKKLGSTYLAPTIKKTQPSNSSNSSDSRADIGYDSEIEEHIGRYDGRARGR